MGDISPNFNRSEFHCKCGNCKPIAVDVELVNVAGRLITEDVILLCPGFDNQTTFNKIVEYLV